MDSTRIMMSYGFQHLGITMFQVKISMKNESSIKLFQDKLDFQVNILYYKISFTNSYYSTGNK